MPVAKVEVPCPHCGSGDRVALWAGREHEYENTTDEQFAFVRCPRCGLVRLDPRPDVSELGRIYPPDYYAYNLISDEPDSDPGFTDRMKMRMYQRRLEGLVERVGRPGTLRVLDVGCADGRLLDWYKQSAAGERIETHGIEMDEAAAATARRRGHRVVTGRFEVDRELEPGSFDVILALHVIEHVDDPEGFARHAAELLTPGGVLFIATPNWDAVDARRMRGHWGGNHFPRHWTLYDERTLRALAGSIGLELERVEYQPNPIFWVWSCHSWLRDRFPGRRWPDRLFPPVAIFDDSVRSFVLLSAFTVLDTVLRRLTGRTGSIAVEMRRPAA
jgi:SAM-dependent methyltransferase